MDSSLYVPAAPAPQAAAAAVAPSGTTTAERAGIGGGLLNDPTMWIIILLAMWAGAVHFGLSAGVNIGGGK